jgi:adenosylhomocysteine nucleosidase
MDTSPRAAPRKLLPRVPPDMRILVTFAVEAEFAPWRKLRNLKKRQIDEIVVHEAKIGRAVVDLVVTGMGLESATAATRSVLSKEHDFCIAAGFAGALRPKFKVGDILAAEAVQFLGKPKILQSNRNLAQYAEQDGALFAKMLVTADHVVRTQAEKSSLAPFAEFVDMESFGVFSAANEIGRPAVAIRVISDGHDGELPVDVELTMSKKGQVQIGRVVRYLARYPSTLPALIRLGRDSRTASEALAAFLESYIKKISFFTHGWYPEGENLETLVGR